MLTRGVKNFLRRAFFCFFNVSVERKKFQAYCKKFPAYMKKTKRSANKIFYTTCKAVNEFLLSIEIRMKNLNESSFQGGEM